MVSSKQGLSKSVILLLFVLTLTVAFSIGFFVGESRAARGIVPAGEGQVTDQGDVPAYLSEDVSFDQFWDVWNFVKEEFYTQPVSDKELFYGALKGLVSGLDDDYSAYLDPEETAQFTANLEGSFEGIGAEIGIRDERLQVVAPLAGRPAEQAGLLPGDWIVAIDGVETFGMSTEEAVTRIRGEGGTVVVLTIAREGVDGLQDVEIVRAKIVIESVAWEITDDNVMIVGISTFNHDTSELFNDMVLEALEKDVAGIVLDLRSNPGGLLTTAIDIASAWVGYETVLIERIQSEARAFDGAMTPRLNGIPTIVLVNGGSASASEIVAGALQDYDLAVVVGTQTFGKGSVQDYREFPDGSAVKITTASWFTPLGRGINETGIAPDLIVDYTLEQYEAGVDPQLETAMSILNGTYEQTD